jgi:hypothetical protein
MNRGDDKPGDRGNIPTMRSYETQCLTLPPKPKRFGEARDIMNMDKLL